MRPIFVENSKIPVILSKISPINIYAISLVFFVFCRGTLNETTRRHETIHFRQWLELLIIGFAILYVGSWIWLRFIRRYDGETAYRMIPFEQEAYDNQHDVDYLSSRRLFAWAKYFKRNRGQDGATKNT